MLFRSRFINDLTCPGSSAGSPKRRCTARCSRASSAAYPGPTAALTGEIMSPITYSGASCSSAASRQRGSNPGCRWAQTYSTTMECWATEKACSPVV